MCQLWIDHDTDVDLIALSRRTDHAGLRDMAVFDAVVNNADRKIGHLLPVADGHLYGCDHGVCFAEDYKLRTVLWQWRGKTLPRRSLEALRRLNGQLNDGGLEAELSSLLSADEIAATKIRVETLLKHRVHPYPRPTGPPSPGPRSKAPDRQQYSPRSHDVTAITPGSPARRDPPFSVVDRASWLIRCIPIPLINRIARIHHHNLGAYRAKRD